MNYVSSSLAGFEHLSLIRGGAALFLLGEPSVGAEKERLGVWAVSVGASLCEKDVGSLWKEGSLLSLGSYAHSISLILTCAQPRASYKARSTAFAPPGFLTPGQEQGPLTRNYSTRQTQGRASRDSHASHLCIQLRLRLRPRLRLRLQGLGIGILG